MKFNENSIFLKTKKKKMKKKIMIEKRIKMKIEKRKNLYTYILIFTIFILFIIILRKFVINFNKFYTSGLLNSKNTLISSKNISESSSFERVVISSSLNGNKPKIVAITYGNYFFQRQIKLYLKFKNIKL